MGPARYYGVVIGGLAAVVIASHLLGATILTVPLWGTHFYAFFPFVVLAAALAATLGALAWVLLRRGRGEAEPVVLRRAAGPAATIAFSVLAGVLFWLLRLRHTLLGDSGVLSQDIALGLRAHPRQPLAVWMHHHFYQFTRGLFDAAGRAPADIAFDTIALETALTGALFVPVALALAREVLPQGAPAATDRVGARTRVGPAWIAAAFLTQGYVQLFFGYVENYAVFTLLLAAYLWAGLRFLNGRCSLLLAALPLIVAIGFNLSGVALLPSFAALAAWGFARSSQRGAVARDVILTIVLMLGLSGLLGALGGGTSAAGVRYMWGLVIRGEAGGSSAEYLLSATHWRDFLAIHLLTGPFAGFLLLSATIHRLMTGRIHHARVLFLLTAALPAFAASWLFGDPLQGFPRDWDLFAPFALVSSVAGLACIAWEPLEARTARRLLATIVVVSLFHTGSWVAINSCFDRSFARYQTLPISRGRTEMVVGFWYLNHGMKEKARDWFERSVTAYPGNNAAQHQLGLFAMDEGRYAEAAERFRVATLVRPDKGEYRFALVDALVVGGRPAEALPELDRLVQQDPGRAEFHACRGIVLAGLDRRIEARAALERAREIAPADPLYGSLIAHLDEPAFYSRALREDWDRLVLK